MTVQLRAPVKSDFSLLAALRNDESIQRQLMIEACVYLDAEVQAWIRRRTDDPQGAFWVVDADGPRGFVQLTQIQSGSADLGICLAANVRGKGVAGHDDRYSRHQRCDIFLHDAPPEMRHSPFPAHPGQTVLVINHQPVCEAVASQAKFQR